MGFFTAGLLEGTRWATGAGAAVSPEPTTGKRDLGWASAEKPPNQYFNVLARRTYECLAEIDGLLARVLTWSGKHTFSAGLASSVAPSAGSDVVRKTELDAEVTARNAAISTHDGVTNPHSATAAATADRLVLRDAAGRAKFADPADAQDAATKRYADEPALVTPAAPTMGPGWSAAGGSAWIRKKAGVVSFGLVLGVSSPASASWSAICTFPVGCRPAAGSAHRFHGILWDFSTGAMYDAVFTLDQNGVLLVWVVANGSNGTYTGINFPTIATSDSIDLFGSFVPGG